MMLVHWQLLQSTPGYKYISTVCMSPTEVVGSQKLSLPFHNIFMIFLKNQPGDTQGKKKQLDFSPPKVKNFSAPEPWPVPMFKQPQPSKFKIQVKTKQRKIRYFSQNFNMVSIMLDDIWNTVLKMFGKNRSKCYGIW